MAKIQEVSLNAADNSEPIFDSEPSRKVPNCDDNYNVFTNDVFLNDLEHPEQPTSSNGYGSYQDDQMIQKQRNLLASLIKQLKVEIDGSKQNNKSLE
uniref:Uncharacterized protein n=1 Tax=Tanacetum cinerariifolium TaxID=118510 RepID=A0A699S7A5_TANCI|nr:hypothetical protein [Tanacetum cinerariifolium]